MEQNKGIILIEGPDACGKSYLQKFFVDKYGAIPIHLTYPPPGDIPVWDYHTREMIRAIELSDNNLVVVDRHWISELIYAKVFRNGSPWPYMGRMMDRVWRKHGTIYIMCLPLDVDITIRRHRDNINKNHPYTDDKFREVVNGYLIFYDNGFDVREDVYAYRLELEGRRDVIGDFAESVVQSVQYHRDWQYPPALSSKNQNILGSLSTAKHLLIGERVNKKDNYFSWPFYEYRNCSLFLSECLAELSVDETDLMWTNVYDEHGDGSTAIYDLVELEMLKPIIFGNEAEKIVKEQIGSPYEVIMHPAYAQRFQKKEEFKASLLQALGE